MVIYCYYRIRFCIKFSLQRSCERKRSVYGCGNSVSDNHSRYVQCSAEIHCQIRRRFKNIGIDFDCFVEFDFRNVFGDFQICISAGKPVFLFKIRFVVSNGFEKLRRICFHNICALHRNKFSVNGRSGRYGKLRCASAESKFISLFNGEIYPLRRCHCSHKQPFYSFGCFRKRKRSFGKRSP